MSGAKAFLVAVSCCFGAIGCTGTIGGEGALGSSGGSSGTLGPNGATAGSGTGDGSGTGATPGDPNAAGILPLRRLTAREYLNTVRDLLADTSLSPGDVPNEPDDTSNKAFPFRQPGSIGTVDAKALEDAGEQLAKNLAPKLSAVLPCSPATAADEASCANQFIASFGTKLYRRPLSAAETSDLGDLYQTARTTLGLDFKGAIELLVEAMLQAPGFLYHWEQDPGPSTRSGEVVQLGNYWVANRLSYFLWGSMPDAELFAAAAAGSLSTAAGVEQQARRMLADDKAKDTIADFFDDWLDVNTLATRPKDPAIYPQWNQSLAADMESEVRSFGTASVFGSGQFTDLLLGTSSAVDQPLSAIYGLSGISGSTPQTAHFDPAQRAGLLTLAGFLTVNAAADGSSPVRRGHAVYTRLLCQTLPDPPGNVPPPAPPTPGLTTRARFTKHDQNACTGGCHKVMDPIGFGYERYDGLGQYRTMDQNLPVDSSGSIDLDGKTQTFADGVALSRLLAASPEVQACFTTQILRYALNRWDSPADLASIQKATSAFTAAKLDMRELIVALATSRTFRYRSPGTGEIVE